jgi:hypothetical protein
MAENRVAFFGSFGSKLGVTSSFVNFSIGARALESVCPLTVPVAIPNQQSASKKVQNRVLGDGIG